MASEREREKEVGELDELKREKKSAVFVSTLLDFLLATFVA